MRSMKRVLCFGDSNTWGQVPAATKRYSRSERWPGIVAQAVGSQVAVLENGICGRSTVWDDPLLPSRNGSVGLKEALLTECPLDLLILSLGTNDLKFGTPDQIAQGMRTLIEIAQNADAVLKPVGSVFPGECKILILSPVSLHREIAKISTESSLRGFYQQSTELASCLQRVAKEMKTDFMDATGFAQASDKDGIHMDRQSHMQLGCAVANRVKQILAL